MKKYNFKILTIIIIFLAIVVAYYYYNKTHNSKSDCDSCKEGFRVSPQYRIRSPQITGGGKSMTAIKYHLKTVKNRLMGFKNYVDVNYYYDKINNLLS
jgi:hypothetical protein